MLFLTQGCPLIFNHLLGLCILEGNKEGQRGGGGDSRKGKGAVKLFPFFKVPKCEIFDRLDFHVFTP